MEKRSSKSYVPVGLTAEQGCGDMSPPSVRKVSRAGAQEAHRGPERGRITILKRDNASGKTEGKNIGSERLSRSNEPIVISLSGGGQTVIRAFANAPRQAPLAGARAPPKKWEEWIPYISSTPSDYAPPLSSRRRVKSQGSEQQQKVSTGHQRGQDGSKVQTPLAQIENRLENEKCWYSRSPLPDKGAMPFRRKRSVTIQAGVSWAEDEYWTSWDGWDEVIQWGG